MPRRVHFLLAAALVAALTAAIALVGGQIALRSQLVSTGERDDIQLGRYTAILTLQIHRLDSVPEMLSYRPDLQAVLKDPHNPDRVRAANEALKTINSGLHAAAIYVLSTAGEVLASSNYDQRDSYVGEDLSFRPYFIEAMHHGVGSFYGVGTTISQAGYFHAARINGAGGALGVAVVKIGAESFGIPGTGTPYMMVVDENHVVFVSNNRAWLYHSVGGLASGVQAALRQQKKYNDIDIVPLHFAVLRIVAHGRYVARIAADGAQKAQAFFVSEDQVPDTPWRMLVLDPMTEFAPLEHAVQILLVIICLATVLSMAYLKQKLRILSLERDAGRLLSLAKERLEADVAQRTHELVCLNRALTAEITQHEAARAEATSAQKELARAANLAALGQMAATLAHEINQPLSALRTFSDNARNLLSRRRFEELDDTLVKLSAVVMRIARITSALKELSTRPKIESTSVNMSAVVEACLLILSNRIEQTGARVVKSVPPELCVRADQTALERVMINILGNAIDATSDRVPVIRISTVREGDAVLTAVADNGTGLVGLENGQLERVFEAFYTTKAAGKGMGLGLAISYRLMTEMGGGLTVAPGVPDGAVFTISLPLSDEASANE